MPGRRPVVGIVSDRALVDGSPFHGVSEEYIAAVTDAASALPLLIPVCDARQPAALLDAVDGLLLPGSASNIAPALYGGPVPRPGTRGDAERDATALALIRAAAARGVPVFGICRGFQEINVAFGGTLHPRLHEIPGRLDHREDERAPMEIQYAPAHSVSVVAGGRLAEIVVRRAFPVNSLHAQGIDRLAPRLRAEAHAPDGQIEAISLSDANTFFLGVQWHPEYRCRGNAVSRRLFASFGAAMKERTAVAQKQLSLKKHNKSAKRGK